jgi:hypothetical protein
MRCPVCGNWMNAQQRYTEEDPDGVKRVKVSYMHGLRVNRCKVEYLIVVYKPKKKKK